MLANGAKPDWESQVLLSTHAGKVAIRFLLGSSYRFSYLKAAEGCSAVHVAKQKIDQPTGVHP
jgi:hypothetical protein